MNTVRINCSGPENFYSPIASFLTALNDSQEAASIRHFVLKDDKDRRKYYIDHLMALLDSGIEKWNEAVQDLKE